MSKKPSMPVWMIIAGVITAIAGVINMFVANFVAKSTPVGVDGPNTIVWGLTGLGALIFGGALFLAGLTVAALRKS